MRPISGQSDPYGAYLAPRRPAADSVPVAASRSITPGDASPSADVELSMRIFADGRSISVRRQTIANADGTRRTVGIDAVIR